jgi:hypothetical protein
MSLFRTCLLLFGLGLAVGWGQSSALSSTAPGDKAAPGKEGERKRKPKFTVSKETTYVTGPLRKDGTVDYAAALNERLSKGVTPENNANVLFWKAFGPHPERATMPPEFFKWLGYQPPERGDYFTEDLSGYLSKRYKGDPEKQDQEITDLIDRVTERSWTAKQYPQVAAWLKANAKPLAVAVEGTKRTHYFAPLTPRDDSGLIGALLAGVAKCRALGSALTVRAMLHLGEGRFDEAWQDLLACHRLGRLVARGGTLIEQLVGIALDSMASGVDLAYLDRAQLTAQQAKDRLRDLQRLPPMPPIADKVDLGERFVFLDCVMLVARGGPQTLEALAGGAGRRPKIPSAKDREALASIDWDPALHNGNLWYDRMVATMRLKDRAVREKAFDKIDQDLADLRTRLLMRGQTVMAQILLGVGSTPQAVGKAIGDVMITLLMPAVRRMQQAEDRSEQTQRNLHVAFALAAYKADHGRYPMKLEQLTPKYLARVPGDLFSGKPLICRLTEKGYLLYSVGVNGQDDQGRTQNDDPQGDDLVVRMPLPELRRK